MKMFLSFLFVLLYCCNSNLYATNWIKNDSGRISEKEWSDGSSKPIIFGKYVDSSSVSNASEHGCNGYDKVLLFDISIFSRIAGSSFDVNNIYVDGVATGEWALNLWLEEWYKKEGHWSLSTLEGNNWDGEIGICVGTIAQARIGIAPGSLKSVILWYDGSVQTTYHPTPQGGEDNSSEYDGPDEDISKVGGALAVSNTGQKVSDVNGFGSAVTPTDSATPGLPNFIGNKIELSNYNPKKTDSVKVRAQFKNTGVEDISADDMIESRFYLSKGYKEDSHSEWIRIGKEQTKGYNLDPGETHWEEEDLRLWNYSIIEAGKTYNLVACIDRTADNDNGDGEYPEKHKSDNCTSEAVFTVAEDSPAPSTEKFVWSSAGTIANRVCTQINEPSDPHAWSDNYLCADSNYQLQWSYNGPISNMRCTQIIESADPDSWNNNYLCVPTTSNIYFSWSSAGPIDSQ